MSHRELSDQDRDEREAPAPPDPGGLGQGPSAFRQVFTSLFIPDGTTDEVRWFNELQRVSATPGHQPMCAAFF